ncbi:PilC/PilY family type IV pilus protein [soil metagenome]
MVLLFTLFCAATVSLAQTGPSQIPLLNRGANVKPNIMLVLDNSGSMIYTCLYLAHANAVLEAEYGILNKIPGQNVGCTTGAIQDSPANNSLMYDPARRYATGFNDSGVPLGNAAVAGVPFKAGEFSGDVVVYLPKAGVDVTQYKTVATLGDVSHYDKLEVTAGQFRLNDGVVTRSNPLPKFPSRTDCISGARCTPTEEAQNIANWRAFHTSRLQAAKTGIGIAFNDKPDTFRLGWTSLADPFRYDGQPVMTITGVKDYGLSKGEFYKWLNHLAADNSSGTWLRQSLDTVGQYYERTDNRGPWAHTPWRPGSERAAEHLSCRRSFTVLTTDGFWNDQVAPGSVAGKDIDGTPGALIKKAFTDTTYQYTPHDTTDPRNVGKADSTTGSGNAGTLADIALYYWSRDLRGDEANKTALPNNADIASGAIGTPFWQNMTTYTVGLGVPGKMTATEIANAKLGTQNWTKPVADTPSALDDLVHAAYNGGGQYLSVRDAASFGDQLGNVIKNVGANRYSEAGVAASSTTLSAGTSKFVPYYTQGSWWGNLKMFSLSNTGAQGDVRWQVVDTDLNGQPTGTTTIPNFNSRNIWTWVDASKRSVEFKYATLQSASLIAADAAANAPGLLKDGTGQEMVDYLRGNTGTTGAASGFRQRSALLGDIVNSAPLFIKNISNFQYEKLPAATAGLKDYDAYMKMKNARREGAVFVGANDGMLHAFREGVYQTGATSTAVVTPGGTEVFAYVPRGVLGNLYQLADRFYQHQYFVDGSLVEADAWLATPNSTGSGISTGWRNLLVGTTGAGGRAVFALNVTDPLNMNGNSVLWEVNGATAGFTELGYVNAPVQTGIMQDGTWVAIFGNGYFSKSGQASIFVVNLATGALVKQIDTAAVAAGGNGLGGVRLVLNADQQIMGAYAGDLKGRVWKFDFNSATQGAWKLGLGGQPLYTALDSSGKAQPVTAMPAVIVRNDNAKYKPSYMVVVGTGKLVVDADATDGAKQAAYGLWDQEKFGDAIAGTTITSSQLVQLTTTAVAGGFYTVSSPTPVDPSRDRGWILPYTIATGQRTLYPVETLRNLVRIDTVAPPPPVSTPSCDSQAGQGYNFIINPLTGLCKAKATFDVNNDGVITDADSTACGYTTTADGEDAVMGTSLVSGGGSGTTAGGGTGTSSSGAGGTTGGSTAAECSGSIYSIQNSTGQRLVDVGCEPHASSGASSRAWRQIFMRVQ